ncbi:MAG: hypothetical protein WC488_03110 [Candidatus Micrarchaeia archaeon]
MKYIGSAEVEAWIDGTRLNKPSAEVEFGQYRAYLDDGVLLMRNNARGQIDILGNAKFGIPQLSPSARLVFSELLEKDGCGNAGFFALDAGWRKAVYFSASYSGEEVGMRTAEYELEFELGRDYDASAFMGSLMVLDRKNGKYEMMMPDGRTLSARIKLGKNSFCFMVNRELGIITNRSEVHVIHDGVRHLIDLGRGEALDEPLVGTGRKDGCDWLVVKDARWKKKCVVIALGGPERYCYAVPEMVKKVGKGDSEGIMR